MISKHAEAGGRYTHHYKNDHPNFLHCIQHLAVQNQLFWSILRQNLLVFPGLAWLFRYPQPRPPREANGICKLCCGLNQLPSAIQLIKSEKRVDFHSFSRSKQFTSPQTFNKGTFSFLLLHLLMPVKSAKSQLRQKLTFIHKTRPEISHVALVNHTNNAFIISIHKTCLKFSLVCIPGRHHSLPLNFTSVDTNKSSKTSSYARRELSNHCLLNTTNSDYLLIDYSILMSEQSYFAVINPAFPVDSDVVMAVVERLII